MVNIISLELIFETQSYKKKKFIQINQGWKNQKINQIMGKNERITIKEENIFVWDNAWAMNDVWVCILTSQYHQSA